MDNKEERYGKMTVRQLKEMLKERNASVKGRKSDLVKRLIFYEETYGECDVIEPHMQERIQVPSVQSYKDVHGDCPIPKFNSNHLKVFLLRYDKEDVKPAKRMYAEGYLVAMRYSQTEVSYYLKGLCNAMMKKHIQYEVDVLLHMNGEIQGSSCECASGWSKDAHCKHVLILLMALEDMNLTKKVVLHQSSTQSLQTFHHPAKAYNGSPKRASTFKRASRRKIDQESELSGASSTSPSKYPKVVEIPDGYPDWYQNHFRNTVINCGFNSSMPIKQLFKPACVEGVDLDHTYSRGGPKTDLLRRLKLLDVSSEDIMQIEYETRGQASNPLWFNYKSCRISASKFYEACNGSPKRAQALVQEILYPKTFTSAATAHGIKHESDAVNDFNEYNGNQLDLKECGLFVLESHPFICGTPDRLNCLLSVIEVKCPFTAQWCEINELTVPCLLRDEKGNISLDTNHPYYYQVQGQLLVTRRSYCDFIVWNFVDMLHLSIERDDKFIDEMVQDLTFFYETYLQPEILKKFLYKNTKKISRS